MALIALAARALLSSHAGTLAYVVGVSRCTRLLVTLRTVCDRWCRNLLGFAVISNHGTCDGSVRSGCSVRVVATAPYWTDDLL